MSVVTGQKAASRGMLFYTREVINVANIITLSRLLAGFAIVYLCRTGDQPDWMPGDDYRVTVFWLALYGALSDLVDGFIARWLGPTTVGKKIDQVFDKLFGLSLIYGLFSFEGITWYNGIPALFIVLYGIVVSIWRYQDLVADSTRVAKWRNGIQLGAGAALLGFAVTDSMRIHVIAYVVLWASLYLSYVAYRDYLEKVRLERIARGWRHWHIV